MNHIRLANKEEVDRIRAEADLTPETGVWALDNAKGEADLACVRHVVEIDPMFPAASSNTAQKARFIWGVEERLMGSGITAYYFDVLASEDYASWRKVVQSWGAEQLSTGPSIRYKKVLVKA